MNIIFEDVSDEYLEHYGVRGMKWGVRKQPSRATSSKARKTRSKGASLVVNNLGNKVKLSAIQTKNKAGAALAKKKEINTENKLVKQAKKDPSKLTNEELQRVSQRMALANKAQSDATSSNTYNTSKRAAKKAAKNSDKLSDAELQYRTNRARQEQNLKQLTDSNYKKEHKIAKAVGKTTLNVATNALSGGMKYGINTVLQNAGLEALGSAMTGIKPKQDKKKGDYTYDDIKDIIDRANSRNLSGISQKDLDAASEWVDSYSTTYKKSTSTLDDIKTSKASHTEKTAGTSKAKHAK